MKKFLFVFLLTQLTLSSFAWSQSVKIIDVSGKVTVKKDVVAQWEDAKKGMQLSTKAEIKTEDGTCTLAFDKDSKNVLTLKENSYLKLENLLPVLLTLPRGKLLALINDIGKVKKFEVKTPVALAGVRGTGESVESNDNGTTVICFEHVIYVNGLDPAGNPVGAGKSLEGGFGVVIDPNGNIGEPFGNIDMNDWQNFLNFINALLGNSGDGELGDIEDATGEGIMDDLRLDEQNQRRQDDFLERRGGQGGRDDSGDSGSGGQDDGDYPSVGE